jgi:tRNA (adenine22-N1)-methyltransferase
VKRRGDTRRAAIVELAPRGGFIVDVGADHGRVAEALGAVAVERHPHRRGSAKVRWVVSDGLTAFRNVDVAVIAGIGASSILEILRVGPAPSVIVVHATDSPGRLRIGLRDLGWRIEAERLAWENGRYAEVIRAVQGMEVASGLWLELGPRLLEEGPPELADHLSWLLTETDFLLGRIGAHAPDKAAALETRASFLRQQIHRLADRAVRS